MDRRPLPTAAWPRRRSSGPAFAAAAVALAAALSLAGCRFDPPTITPPPPTVAPFSRITPSPEARAITLEVRTSVIGPGFDRFAFVLADDGDPIETGTVEATFYQQGSSGPQRIANGPALFFGSGLTGGGRWVTYTDFSTSGPWSVDIVLQKLDGSQGIARADFQVSGRTQLPADNQPPPLGETPYAEDAGDVAGLTTDSEPLEDLYDQSVATAVASGRATVIHFSSPGNCPDAACKDALTPIKRAAVTWDGGVHFIHIESRDPANPSELSATAKAWALPGDPWTFVFDRQGRLHARVEGPVGTDELNLLVRHAAGIDGSSNVP